MPSLTIDGLIDYLASLVCIPRTKFDRPNWRDGWVYVTDGYIAFKFYYPEEPQRADWAIQRDDEHWITTGEYMPPNLESTFMLHKGVPFKRSLPRIRPEDSWINPYRTFKKPCPECNGTCKVRCNYDHYHRCPECEDGTTSTRSIDAWLNEPSSQRFIDLDGVGQYDRRYLWILQELCTHRPISSWYQVANDAIHGFYRLTREFEDGVVIVASARYNLLHP